MDEAPSNASRPPSNVQINGVSSFDVTLNTTPNDGGTTSYQQVAHKARRTLPSYQWKPELLGLPNEIRDHIYSYLLVVDQSVDCEPLSKAWNDRSGLLRWNAPSQLYREAHKFLKDKNIWICLEVVPEQPTYSAMLYALSCDRYKRQPYIMLGPDVVQSVKRAASIKFLLGERCYLCSAESWCHKHHKPITAVFAYSQYSYAQFCCELLKSVRTFKKVVVCVEPSNARNQDHIAEILIRPLSMMREFDQATICGLKSPCPSWLPGVQRAMTRAISGWSDIIFLLRKFREAGVEAFRNRKYATAAHFFSCGVMVGWYLGTISTARGYQGGFPSTIEARKSARLQHEMNGDLALSVYNHVESHRTPQGQMANVTWWQMDHAWVTAKLFAGLTNQPWTLYSRQKWAEALYLTAVAYANQVEYAQLFGNDTDHILAAKVAKLAVVRFKEARNVSKIPEFQRDVDRAISRVEPIWKWEYESRFQVRCPSTAWFNGRDGFTESAWHVNFRNTLFRFGV